MATKKSPARGTGSRPAKTTTAISKTRPTAKKPVKAAAKPAAIQSSPVAAKPAAIQSSPVADSNVVQLPPVEDKPVAAESATPEMPVEPAKAPAKAGEELAIEEVAAKAETVVAPPAPIDEPEPFEELIPLKDHAERMVTTAEPEAEIEQTTAEENPADEPEVEMTFKSNAFSGASLFPGFPQFPNMPEFPAFGAVDMNAFVASGTAMVEGMQSIGKEMMDYSRKTAERNVEATKAVFGASSVQEAIEVQSRHATGSMNDLVAESTKLSGMAMDVASKAASSFTRS